MPQDIINLLSVHVPLWGVVVLLVLATVFAARYARGGSRAMLTARPAERAGSARPAIKPVPFPSGVKRLTMEDLRSPRGPQVQGHPSHSG